MPLRRTTLARCLLGGLLAGPATAGSLPAAVDQALRQAQIPDSAIAVVVQPVGSGRSRLSLNATQPMNPASVFKLVTTGAALDLLGPGFSWSTPVWLRGPLRQGRLEGDLVIQGSGDPTLVVERVWLLLRRLRQLGLQEIGGDIVLDRSAFADTAESPADFDGEPLKPYNVRPDALLLNLKAVRYTLLPDAAQDIARIGAEPALAGVQVDTQVPLAKGECGDWRGQLGARFDDPHHVRFAGSYPLACGERGWPVAWVEPAAYNARLLQAMWQELGGRLVGSVRDGVAPRDMPPTLTASSPPLAEVVRDINKFSNNVMAQQLFLTLGLQRQGSGTPPAGREVLRQWLLLRFGADAAAGVVIDNGSGLSRETRISAALLAQLLLAAEASPLMPELLASLPLAGIDGTLQRVNGATGQAHLKTGSLRDVVALAGEVMGRSGQRYVLVALVNHPKAQAARPALEALLQWTHEDLEVSR
jgi:D-alanyl-D-alanine carboxypeptidase/D-alanyl-D-alanine-endopeptidase (penicillin-binding protein 4)